MDFDEIRHHPSLFGHHSRSLSIMVSILIADDEPHIRALLRMIVTPHHQPIEAGDGTTALRIALEHRPQVAILDVSMPGMSGVDVSRHLRSDARTADIGIIIVTANGTADDRAAALAAGADHFLTKPFSPSALVRLIESLIEARTPVLA
jgi:two-component system phosphate regulon response regulator PhoB